MAPAGEPGGETAPDSDQRLVAAVRAGDDRAFEALYQRYQRRIYAYVLGMVKDHGRAEDVTQEVFVSALRRMRATDRTIAFKPWIYEIAKNACIDAFRRSRRSEEVSYDAEEGLAPSDHTRLAAPGPSPEAAVSAKHDLETLCGAFGGLSESHHQILVLRELEGLTYEQIGARMGMTRPAVESTLFRARRRLTEEYDELVSGARCLRVRSIIAAAASGALGVRDSRRLSRHLSHCQPCRREALAAGLDRGLLVRRPAARRIVDRVAGVLPLPGFLRLRRGGDLPASDAPGARWAAHLPALSDQLSGPWAKAGAAAALLVAGTGVGVGAHQVATGGRHPATHPVVVSPAAHKTSSSTAAGTADTGTSVTGPATSSRSGGARGDAGRRSDHSSGRAGSSRPAVDRATSGGGGTSSAPSGSSGASSSSPASSASSGGDASTPKVKLPTSAASDPVKTATGDAGAAVQNTVDQAAGTVDSTVQGATGAVQDTVQGATGAVQQATGDGPVGEAVDGATGAVNGAVGGAAGTVNQTTGAVTQTVRDTTGALLGGS